MDHAINALFRIMKSAIIFGEFLDKSTTGIAYMNSLLESSLKSLKKRDLNSKLVKRRGKLYVINKKNPKFKARQG